MLYSKLHLIPRVSPLRQRRRDRHCLGEPDATGLLTFRPQGLAPSRRLTPLAGTRACCIPHPILGFAPFPGPPTCRRIDRPASTFPGTRLTPPEGFHSPAAASRHRDRCPLVVFRARGRPTGSGRSLRNVSSRLPSPPTRFRVCASGSLAHTFDFEALLRLARPDVSAGSSREFSRRSLATSPLRSCRVSATRRPVHPWALSLSKAFHRACPIESGAVLVGLSRRSGRSIPVSGLADPVVVSQAILRRSQGQALGLQPGGWSPAGHRVP
jgi:hypothetical protein